MVPMDKLFGTYADGSEWAKEGTEAKDTKKE